MDDKEKLNFIKQYLENPPIDIYDNIYTNDSCKCHVDEVNHMTNGEVIYCDNCGTSFKPRWKSKDCISFINEFYKHQQTERP
jgi:predicted nucleic acid-binding Zn ribbon protein